MCVICCKPAGVAMPKDEYIENMWFRNPDGAGLMYMVDGKVRIVKGFMDFESFKEELEEMKGQYDLTKLPMVMHFRITTHGGTKPANCHPFPIADSVGVLSKLVLNTEIGVAHNGIIDITPRKGISDTMEYIISQLYPLYRACPKFYENKWLMKMVSNAIDSKMAFLTSQGDIYTIGDFQTEDGIKYSNNSFKCPGYYKSFTYSRTQTALADYWETKDQGSSYYYKDVMWLDDGEYVKNLAGDIFDGDFAIDSNGLVYSYSYQYGGLVRMYGYTAYNQHGIELKFDINSQMTTCEEIVW